MKGMGKDGERKVTRGTKESKKDGGGLGSDMYSCPLNFNAILN
jgi:hypothetical protein